MLKRSFIVIFILTFFHVQSQENMENTIYQFKVTYIYGKIYDFSQLKGKKVMIVNTASKCGLTYQYKALQELYNSYSIYNFVVI
ncbi:MAG: glutathione peroxidase, partial [Bacteroidota bacterium]|nr:glutathione peroxidase [Bacteroidota bacterium]